MVISSHNSSRVLFDKIASVYFISKIYLALRRPDILPRFSKVSSQISSLSSSVIKDISSSSCSSKQTGITIRMPNRKKQQSSRKSQQKVYGCRAAYIYVLALEMASAENQHCVNCIVPYNSRRRYKQASTNCATWQCSCWLTECRGRQTATDRPSDNEMGST